MIFLGFFAGKAGFLGEAGIRGLGAFVFNFAIPPHVFRLMAETELGRITEWGFLGGYFLAQAAAFLAGASVARLAFGMRAAEMTIQAFGSAFSNGVMLALPLLLWVYGDAGGVPALLIITLHVIALSLGHGAAGAEPARRRRGRLTGRRLRPRARCSSTRSSWRPCSAFSLSRSGLTLPGVAEQTLSFIGGAAAPVRPVRARRLAQSAPHRGQPRPRWRHGRLQVVPASPARLARFHLPA